MSLCVLRADYAGGCGSVEALPARIRLGALSLWGTARLGWIAAKQLLEVIESGNLWVRDA